MRIAVAFCAVLSLAACGEDSQTNTQLPATTAAIKLPKPLAKTGAEQLAEFKNDLTICTSAMLTFEKDRAFLEAFMDANKRSAKPLEDFLRQASFSKSADIQYILANRKYFVIDVSFHPTEFAVAWVKDEPVYCGVSEQRLEEIEVLGESPEAWEVRQYFLDRWLKDLRSPSDEMDFYPNQYEDFNKVVTPASRLYATNQRSLWLAWVKKAIEHLDSQRGELEEGAGGQTLAEQNKILDKEVAVLTTFLQPSHTETVAGAQVQAASAPAAAVSQSKGAASPR